VLATWTGAELDAFRAVVAPFERQSGIRVVYEATTDLEGELERRIAAGDPPDVSGLVGLSQLADLSGRGVLRDLANALDLSTYRRETAPAFVGLGMVDDRLVGVFLKATLKGLVWYDPRRNRLGEPGSWDDLQRTATRFSTAATRPWCLGLESGPGSGWTGTDWVEDFLLRQSGSRPYDEWVSGTLPWTSPEVRGAFESYLDVASEDTLAGGVTRTLGQTPRSAAQGPFVDPAACLYTHGASFTPAFLQELGLEPGEDYDFFPMPGPDAPQSDVVEVAGDLFGLMTNSREAARLMSWLVSREAQSIWVQHGAALSGNLKVTDYPDAVARREAAILTSASEVRFDASDQMADELDEAFLSAILDVTTEPSRLDEVLARLEDRRLGTDGGPR
jgi:alpha-glucoside transport system substrate-binding protein